MNSQLMIPPSTSFVLYVIRHQSQTKVGLLTDSIEEWQCGKCNFFNFSIQG